MTRPLNLYEISRIHNPAAFNAVEKHRSQKPYKDDVQFHEIESLRLLVDALMRGGLSVSHLDGFFYGFKIPQIGKEFDLLKLTEDVGISIELKSTAVPREQIRAQLLKNRHYLNHLGKQLYLYTVVTDSLTCYQLSPQGQLTEVALTDILQLLQKHAAGYSAEIDSLFRAADYLVSPLRTPEKFIQGEYFLTQAQEQIKREFLSLSGDAGYFHLTGRPGTGKTLLLYDLAKTLAAKGPTLLVHCDALCPGQKCINREIPNLQIVPAADLDSEGFSLTQYRHILVDESHRTTLNQFETVCRSAEKNRQVCIFSSDPEQVLSTPEKQRDIVGKIRALPPKKEFVLSEKLRTNKDLLSFIMKLRNLNHKPQTPPDYSSVCLCYANTTGEAQSLLDHYREKGFVFINYAKPSFSPSPYAQYEPDYDVHRVIGQEFDKVVMLLDDSFYYDENGILQGVPYPDPDYLYPNLFYQGVTRVRENLAIVVVDAPELFEKIAGIL